MPDAQQYTVNSVRMTTYAGGGGYTPIVLLPGLFGGAWIWEEVAKGLAAYGYDVSVMSDPLGLSPTIHDVPKTIAIVTRLLDTLYTGPVVLAGNSMGALIGMEIAAHQPSRVRALVLSGAPGLGERFHPPAELSANSRNYSKDFALAQAKHLIHNEDLLTPELVDRVYNTFDGAGSRQKLAILRCLRATKSYQAGQLFGRITAPTLLAWGNEDQISPTECWQSAVSSFPDARYIGIPDSGHSPMFERPELFLSAMTQFLHDKLPDAPRLLHLASAPASVSAGYTIVRDLIERHGTSVVGVTPETSLSELGLDSLGALELMLTCEDELGVTLLSDTTPEIVSLGDAGAYIDERLKDRAAS